MKALNAKQLLYTLIFLCVLMSGVAFIGFWQYRTISQERQQQALETNVEVPL
ncbi:MAG: hypothetical protein AAB558_01930 [Patescibacteria group bacterium]